MTKKIKSKKPKYIFLVWMALPEDFELYAIPYNETTAEDRKMLKMCHDQYINTELSPSDYNPADIDRALAMLSDKLTDTSKDWFDDDHLKRQAADVGINANEYKSHIGSWHKHKLDRKKPKTIPRSKVIVSGFVM